MNIKTTLLAIAMALLSHSPLAAQDDITFPPAMEADLDSLMEHYLPKNYLYTPNDCNGSDLNPTYTEEEIIDRLQRIPSVMELSYNQPVRDCIDRYSNRLRGGVSYMLGAANFYIPIFEEALEAYNLPHELRFLPVIESALNPKAVSRAGATGLWQFMLATGKMYNLEVNSLVDERRDPILSSYAAAHYLYDLYQVFGDWNLVIAAYNCGPANVTKAINRSDGVTDYWQIYPYLPAETRGYVPAFIAANYIMTYYCDHNICPMRATLPEMTDTVTITQNVHLEQVAAVCNLDIEMLRALNPMYKRDIIPGATKPYYIRLPQKDVDTFIAMEDSIYKHDAEKYLTKRAVTAVKSDSDSRRGKSSGRGAKTIKVRRGDTLGHIAARHGTTVSKLRRLNGIRGNNIRAGQRLRVR